FSFHNVYSISKKFNMEDLREASYILGIKLTRIDSTTIPLSPENYTKSILSRYNMSHCRTTNTPMLPNSRLVKATDEDRDAFLQLNTNYREALGLLNYLSVEIYDSGQITINQCLPTHKMTANMCTKSLGRQKYQEIITGLKMHQQSERGGVFK
ncbi:uncharacterized protein VP01_4293g2, partial [Puccinia sorghi]